MGYYNNWLGGNDRGAYKRQQDWAWKNNRDFRRGRYYGRRDMLRGVLWLVHIAIMVAAMIVMLQVCEIIAVVRY